MCWAVYICTAFPCPVLVQSGFDEVINQLVSSAQVLVLFHQLRGNQERPIDPRSKKTAKSFLNRLPVELLLLVGHCLCQSRKRLQRPCFLLLAPIHVRRVLLLSRRLRWIRFCSHMKIYIYISTCPYMQVIFILHVCICRHLDLYTCIGTQMK